MASLKLSESAFGTVGLTITENIDLAALSASLSALLGQTYQLDSLDVSSITQGGLPNFDPLLNTGGLTATGLGLVGSRLTIGAFDSFFGSFEVGDPLSFSGFETLAFTPQTVAPFADFVWFSIFENSIINTFEEPLTFDDTLRVFDFSAIGSGPLEVRLDAIAPGDTDSTRSGYTIIGNDGDTVFWGYEPFAELSYYGSNTYLLGEGNNTFFGGIDNAHVTGGSGRDVMYGGFGENVLLGGGGDDSLFVFSGNNLLDGGDGDDELFGGFGVDVLLGGAGNDVLFGGESFGDVGSILDGGDGNDWLYGSRGNHELTGGAGRDRFIFANDYNIVTSVEGEGGFVTVHTGFNVSDGESGTNVITDFASTEDLLVFGVRDVQLDFQESPADFVLEFGEGQGGGQQVFFDVFSFQDESGEVFTIQDAQATIVESSVLLRVDQSDYQVVDGQRLDFEIFTDPQTEASRPASFEIVYRDAGQSQGQNFDRFYGLAINPVVEGAPLGGQDKFDLTAMQLTDFDIETGERLEVSDILFSFIDPQQESQFTLFNLLNPDLTPEETVIEGFFHDTENGVSRAMHAEYTFNEFQEIMVYIDADGDGDFSLANDMVFLLSGFDVGFQGFQEEITSASLFNDPTANGSGTGIFIFNESQYDFWFNDEFVVEELPG